MTYANGSQWAKCRVNVVLPSFYRHAIPSSSIGGFGTMQSIIVVSSTRPDMRGRVLGVLAVRWVQVI